MNQHVFFFFRVVREASKDGVPFQVLISLCNAADIIYRSHGKPHDSAEPKSALVWELKPQFARAEEEPSTSLLVHWDINHCNFPQRLCSHWWATDSVPAIPSMQRQELRALPSRCADIKCSISDAKARYKVAQSYHIVNERAQTVHVLVHWWFPVGCGQLRCQRKWPLVIRRFAI